MSNESFGEEILRKINQNIADDPETVEQIEESVNEFLSEASQEDEVLFRAAQFLGRAAFIRNDKRLFYASSALMAISGLLAAQNGGEPVTLEEAMDLADETFEEAQKDFDQAMSFITDDILKEITGD